MKPIYRPLRFAIFALIFTCLHFFAYSQGVVSFTGQDEKRNPQIGRVKIEGRGILDVLAKLAFTFSIPVGFEEASKVEYGVISVSTGPHSRLSDFLNKLVAKDRRYAWRIENGVVNVFPQSSKEEPFIGQLLQTKIAQFSIAGNVGCPNLVHSLINLPEIQRLTTESNTRMSEQGLDGFYLQSTGNKFALTVADRSVRETLNQIVRNSERTMFWSITKESGDDRTYALHLHAAFGKDTEN